MGQVCRSSLLLLLLLLLMLFLFLLRMLLMWLLLLLLFLLLLLLSPTDAILGADGERGIQVSGSFLHFIHLSAGIMRSPPPATSRGCSRTAKANHLIDRRVAEITTSVLVSRGCIRLCSSPQPMAFGYDASDPTGSNSGNRVAVWCLVVDRWPTQNGLVSYLGNR